MATFVDVNLDDAQELKVVEPGEYLVTIEKAEVKDRKNGEGKFVQLRLAIDNEPLTKGITHTLMLPTPQDDAETKNNRLLGLKRLCQATGYDASQGITVEELVGRQCTVAVTIEETPEYGQQNKVRRFLPNKA